MEIGFPLISWRHRALWTSVVVWTLLFTGAFAMLPDEDTSYDIPDTPAPVPSRYSYAPPDDTGNDDESWWEGVEEIDLTLPREEILQSDILSSNESFLWNLECDEFSKIPLPPNWIESIPPPPLPFFMKDMEEPLQESAGRGTENEPDKFIEGQATVTADDTFIASKFSRWIVLEDRKCSLCHWANGGNKTLNIFDKIQLNGKKNISDSMIGALVGVALVSATVGAFLMVVLFKCRKTEAQSSETGSCPLSFVGSLRKNTAHSVQNQVEVTPTPESIKDESPEGIGWVMKRWRRSSSQAPLHISPSPGSENSYSEEPYINADATSTIYAELNSSGTSVRTENVAFYSPDVYSEIPDPIRPCSLGGVCENNGYILSEGHSDPNESSTGSASTPSSAYYSDVSSSAIQSNKKNKRKRKGEDRYNIKFTPKPGERNLSSNIPIQPQYIPRGETGTITLQLIPSNLNLEQNGVEIGISGNPRHHSHVVPNVPMPSQRFFLNNSTHCEPSSISILGPHCVPYCVHFENICPEMMINAQCDDSIQRPLPPVPSRRIINSHQMRNLKSLAGISSKYV